MRGSKAGGTVISLHTCGKGTWHGGRASLRTAGFRDFLINYSRPFIYSTAPSPLTAAAVRAALRLCKGPAGRANACRRMWIFERLSGKPVRR